MSITIFLLNMRYFVSKKCVFLFMALFLCVAFQNPVLASNAPENESYGFYRYNLLTDTDNIRIKASSPGEQFGTTVAKGDFNGDGISDLIVGSPFYSYKDKDWIGRVSLFWGGRKIVTGYRDLKKYPPDVTFRGVEQYDQFGSSVASADVNGDSISDIIVSAYRAPYLDDPEVRPGRVYVIFGRKAGFDKVVDMRTTEPDILILGNKNEDRLGISIATGDFNNDGFLDTAFTSLKASFNDLTATGKVHLLFGRKEFKKNAVYDLNKRPLQMTLYGQESFDYFGSNLTMGDINGDSFDDIFVSSYFADDGKTQDVGKIYVFYGSNIKPSSDVKDIEAGFSPNFSFTGDEAKDWLGFSTAVSDLNNDGFSDLIASAFPFSKDEKVGKAYVVYGRKGFIDKANYKISRIADLEFRGEPGDVLFGASVAAGDFNGDFKKDLLFGAPSASGSDKPGRVYLFYGGFPKSKLISLDNNYPDVIFESVGPDDWFGNNVMSVDINKDQISDIVITSMYGENGKAKNTGEMSIIFGKKRPLGEFKRVSGKAYDLVTRGDFVKHIVSVFGLENKKAKFLNQCKKELDFCLFNFMAESKFNGITFTPNVILYPDVYPAYRNYHYVNLVTMLGLMHGYMTEKSSPFKPAETVTRIQALKVVLGASELLEWRYKSDLMAELGGEKEIQKQASAFSDVDPQRPHMWWYPRYVNYAFLTGIIDFAQEFRPDEKITQSELDLIIEKTLRLID